MTLVRLRREDRLWWVGLDRPAKHNALDRAMVAELDAVLDQARQEPSILIVHSTTPGVFAAGAKLALRGNRSATTTVDLVAGPAVRERRQTRPDDGLP